MISLDQANILFNSTKFCFMQRKILIHSTKWLDSINKFSVCTENFVKGLLVKSLKKSNCKNKFLTFCKFYKSFFLCGKRIIYCSV